MTHPCLRQLRRHHALSGPRAVHDPWGTLRVNGRDQPGDQRQLHPNKLDGIHVPRPVRHTRSPPKPNPKPPLGKPQEDEEGEGASHGEAEEEVEEEGGQRPQEALSKGIGKK